MNPFLALAVNSEPRGAAKPCRRPVSAVTDQRVELPALAASVLQSWRLLRDGLRGALVVAAVVVAVNGVAAPAPAHGTISGQVFNPGTGVYVRDAVVQLAGSDQAVTTETEGRYRLADVPSGVAIVTVTFPGYPPASATVNVTSGQTVVLNLDLAAPFGRSSDVGAIVKLEEFVVSSEREGNAKAIMQQRNSMNITSSVATDVFGELAEGNIGEFLKNMPGVDVALVDGGIRNIRLRGLGAEYTGVTLDGVSVAAADANTGSSGDARAMSFEQVSLTSIDSIEISKTVSADVDANAPAGTINLKTKRAFDRKGRRISWQVNVAVFSEEFTLNRTLAPDERNRRRVRPGASLEYSDVFLNNRLGVVLNLSQADTFSAITQQSMTLNLTPTAADPRPAVATAVTLNHGSRQFDRTSATLTTDFKATPRLTLSLGLVYNYFDQWSPRTNVTLNTGARGTVIGADPLRSFTTSGTNGSVVSNSQAIEKISETFTALPRLEYKWDDVMLEGRFAASVSESWYDPLMKRGALGNFGNPTLGAISFRAQRSSLSDGDWQFTQLTGADWSSGSGFTGPTVTSDDGRYAKSQVFSGEIVATAKTRVGWPVVWKTGLKQKREIRDFNVDTNASRHDYIGPGRGTGAWAAYASPYTPDFSPIGSSVTSTTGRPIFAPYLLGVGSLFREHPEYFAHTLTAANYYDAYIANKKHYEEEITAAYLMGTAKRDRLQFRAGLRWEDTATDSREFDPLTPAALFAAGFPETGGRATTIPGLQYQYLKQPQIHRRGGYDNLFPSAAVKFQFRRNLEAQLGYSRTIRRPSFNNIAGVWSINDDTLRVTAPNPQLQPELSDNLSARLATYFEPVGIAAISVFQNRVTGLFRSSEMTAQQYGYTGPDLQDYTFITTVSGTARTVVRGLELEYSQSLSFLPRPFAGLGVRAGYTRTYSEVVTPQMAPHMLTGGLSYALGRANIFGNLNWKADAPTNITNTVFLRHRLNLDMGGGYRFSDRLSFFFTGKGVLNRPEIIMTRVGTVDTATTYRVWGVEWIFGLKGVF